MTSTAALDRSNDGAASGTDMPDAAHTALFGTLPDGRSVHRYHLGTPGGIELSVLDLGAIIQRLRVPNPDGSATDVVLGASDLDGYLQRHGDYYGAAIGRFANRIADARFTLDGTEHELVSNDTSHTLHGGPDGFHRRLWRVDHTDRNRIELSLVSPDGDQGFPGDLTVALTYEIVGLEVRIRFRASTSAPTPVNLTQHAHFNLDGEGAGSIVDHTLQVNAAYYLPVRTDLIPTGRLAPIGDSPLDFRRPRPVADALRSSHRQISIAGGIDHNLVLAGTGRRTAAILVSSDGARALEVVTDQPGLQVYSGNFFDGSHIGPAGRPYERRAGIALEAQTFPDAPNRSDPRWPSATLRPGECYDTTTIWRFTSGRSHERA